MSQRPSPIPENYDDFLRDRIGGKLSQPPLYEGVCLAYPDEQIVQAPLGQITWHHNIALLAYSAPTPTGQTLPLLS